MTLSHAPVIPDVVRRQHAAFIAGDTRFASAARLLSSLWRADHKLPCGLHIELGSGTKAGKTRKLRAGWRLRCEDALAGLTFLSPDIAAYVRKALILRELGAMWDEAKILGHLLSSQGLALNLFVPMALDLDLATQVWSRLLPDFVHQVTHLKFETSPGRGDERYLHDGTAFDLQLDVITPDGEPAFIAIELKFIEQMIGPSASVRARYGEVARASGLYRSPDDPLLFRPGIEQIRREHTLAQLMVDQGYASRGLFILTGPALNRRIGASAKVYANTLVTPLGATPDRVGFVHFSLETILEALAHAGAADHARAVHARYLDFNRVAAVALGDLPPSPEPPRTPSSPLALPPPRSGGIQHGHLHLRQGSCLAPGPCRRTDADHAIEESRGPAFIPPAEQTANVVTRGGHTSNPPSPPHPQGGLEHRDGRQRMRLSHPWFTKAQRRQLLLNGQRSAAGKNIDPLPVVKLALFDAAATWLLSELDPADPTRAFGLCDLGLGSPELGYVDLTELVRLRGYLKLPVSRDIYFQPQKPLSAYAADARTAGRIIV